MATSLRFPLLTAYLLAVSTASVAQVPIKTIPVATGDQFLLYPSRNAPLGGMRIALEDPLGDGFTNPARSVFATSFVAFTPVFYRISGEDDVIGANVESGTARTIPVSTIVAGEQMAFGAMVAFQQLVSRYRPRGWIEPAVSGAADLWVPPREQTRTDENVYGHLVAAAQIPGTGIAVGAGVTAAHLNGLEGVRLLYRPWEVVDQQGHAEDYRIGMVADLGQDHTLDVTVGHHRLYMKHVLKNRLEEDKTNGIAITGIYRRPLGREWRFGALVAGDWKWHPKIPNYDLMQIPRDPGNSAAYNLGIGFVRRHHGAVAGFEVVYEPIWSHTWAEALEAVDLPQNRRLLPGDRTVENFFRFHNSAIRAGLEQVGERFAFRLGVDLHTIRYRLRQYDNVLSAQRREYESWTEWRLSSGIGYNFAGFEIRYLGRVTLGTGRPGVATNIGFANDSALSNDFVVAGAGPLTVDEGLVLTHRVTVLVPLF